MLIMKENNQTAAEFIEPLFEPMFAPFVEFPDECFPEPVRNYVLAQAIALDCDESAIAIPVLSALAASIGGSRRIEVEPGQQEPAILWTAVVGDAKTNNRPVLRAAVKPLVDRQERALRGYARQMAEFQKNRVASGKKSDGSPLPKAADRYVVRDWRTESLIRLLSHQPRGVLVHADDLDDWLGRPNSSSRSRAIEVSRWLDIYDGESSDVELKSKDQSESSLAHASVNVTGTVSPQALMHKLMNAQKPCGLTSRLLFAQPPSIPRNWTAKPVEPSLTAGYAAVVNQLLSLPFDKRSDEEDSTSPDGQPPPTEPDGDSGDLAVDLVPVVVTASPEAQAVLSRFVGRWNGEHLQVAEPLEAWYTNLAKQATRLALVLHLTRWAAGEEVDPAVCDLESMQRGIMLARWFSREAQRVVALFSINPEHSEQFKLIDWLSRRNGVATVRDLCRSNGRKYPTEEDALAALNRIVDSGVARWVDMPPGKRGGPPYRIVTMGLTSLGQNQHEGSKDAASVARPQSSQGAGVLSETTANGPTTGSGSAVSPAHAAERRATLVPNQVRPAGQRWTIEELAAADPRERLEAGPGSGKPRGTTETSRNRKQ